MPLQAQCEAVGRAAGMLQRSAPSPQLLAALLQQQQQHQKA
jgi:hypothetical protein